MAILMCHDMVLRSLGYRPCVLASKEVVAEGSEFPVYLFWFQSTDSGSRVCVDPGVSQSLSLNNGPVFRKYSPVAVDGDRFALGVKIYKGGKMTEFLRDAKIGQALWWAPKPMKTRTTGCSNVGLIAMGIGITAVLPVLERELSTNPTSKVVLLYCNRTSQDEVWVEKIKTLSETHTDRLTFTRHLTREAVKATDSEEHISHDRLTPDVLAKYFAGWDPRDSAFQVVGSKPQKKAIYSALGRLGFGKDDCKLHVK
eukprot:TRINITY_DN2480_c0_g1_i7.p1 TRINITY_DN2480_c0_g1~~TRINITY_DN2480_c0_g1_i7.p1  ORF type:complete len:255 (+),score=52.90 TRINITY_DN2480_c0_g1_i7:47-811(+)